MSENIPSTLARQHNDAIADIQDGFKIQVKKLSYSPPTLSILETDEISGGIGRLQEADGDGFVS